MCVLFSLSSNYFVLFIYLLFTFFHIVNFFVSHFFTSIVYMQRRYLVYATPPTCFVWRFARARFGHNPRFFGGFFGVFFFFTMSLRYIVYLVFFEGFLKGERICLFSYVLGLNVALTARWISINEFLLYKCVIYLLWYLIIFYLEYMVIHILVIFAWSLKLLIIHGAYTFITKDGHWALHINKVNALYVGQKKKKISRRHFELFSPENRHWRFMQIVSWGANINAYFLEK